jgi:type IV secretory pathway TrbL component
MDLRKTSTALFTALLIGASSTAFAQDSSGGNNSGGNNATGNQSDTTGSTSANPGSTNNASGNDAGDTGNQVRCDNVDTTTSGVKSGTRTTTDPANCPQ